MQPAVHATYAERVGSRSCSSIQSGTDAIEDTTRRIALSLKDAQPRPCTARTVEEMAREVARFASVRALVATIRQLLKSYRARAAATGAALPDERAVDKTSGELFTHWAMHELNQPGLADKVAALVPCASDGSAATSAAAEFRQALVPDLDVGVAVSTPSGPMVNEGPDPKNWSNVKLRATSDGAEPATGSLPWRSLHLATPAPLMRDALIPCGELNRDRGVAVPVFQRCLNVLGGKDKALATQLGLDVTRAAAEARRRLAEWTPAWTDGNIADIPRWEGDAAAAIQASKDVSCSTQRGAGAVESVALACGTVTMPVLTSVFAKLHALYRCRDESAASPEADQGFLRSAFTMLLRYHTLAGGADDADRNSGLHASVHPAFASQLYAQFGVACDAFANPINATHATFFSLFPDVDACFGSRGSFFSAPEALPPSEAIAAHVNPPFETQSIQRTSAALLSLLRSRAVAVPATFVMVVPHWTGDKIDAAFGALLKAPECTSNKLLEPASAAYVDGHLHRLACPFFKLDSQTLLIVLQNEPAKTLAGAVSPSIRPQPLLGLSVGGGDADLTRVDAAVAEWELASQVAWGVAQRRRPRDDTTNTVAEVQRESVRQPRAE